MMNLKRFGTGLVLAFGVLLVANAYDTNTHTTIPSDVKTVGDLEVGGNDLLDSGDTTRLSLGSTNAFTGALTVSGNTTVSGNLAVTGTLTQTGVLTATAANIAIQLSSAPKTSSTVICTTTGTVVWNTADKEMCISSGTDKTTFVRVSTPSLSCTH